jgi:hypothetical protein
MRGSAGGWQCKTWPMSPLQKVGLCAAHADGTAGYAMHPSATHPLHVRISHLPAASAPLPAHIPSHDTPKGKKAAAAPRRVPGGPKTPQLLGHTRSRTAAPMQPRATLGYEEDSRSSVPCPRHVRTGRTGPRNAQTVRSTLHALARAARHPPLAVSCAQHGAGHRHCALPASHPNSEAARAPNASSRQRPHTLAAGALVPAVHAHVHGHACPRGRGRRGRHRQRGRGRGHRLRGRGRGQQSHEASLRQDGLRRRERAHVWGWLAGVCRAAGE